MDIGETSINSMEMFHCGMAKHQQNLPSQSNNPGSLATLGWKSIKTHCNFLKLIFLWQLLLLPFDCVYKEICIKRLCLILYKGMSHLGPLYNMMNVCQEYGVSDIVKASVESGAYMQKYLWKSLVRKKIISLENKRWLTLCKMYKTLNILSVDNYKMCTWWIHAYHDNSYAKQNQTIVRLLLNVFMYIEQICPCCDLNTVNDVVHIMFVCQCNEEVRERLWKELKKNTPTELYSRIESMSLIDRTKFILNACNSGYISEWKVMFDTLSNFICQTYMVYKGNVDIT